ncbi:ExbD/TolR-like translocation protein [Hyphomicrobium denitrificans 1NES1]|uniref:ExbD/TolR-like translocation protein n=1 Tax=Hyphomicrobium denitrificans 1NES1 TaxID=670307 RepID=N0B3L1_9HYPH|nr:hypothetical protein [Hyphomicrobium denitrificans]AGK58094.1 ExbD/TolR-like translocation protein [Hyphomicrobium denitrificans 1NES1]
MKVDVSIGGIATSASRTRALALIREAIAKREADAEKRPKVVNQADNRNQQTRGK